MAKYIKKPVEIEAIQLKDNHQSISEVQKFIQGGVLNNHTCRSAEDAWDNYIDIVRKQGGIKLKTLESDGETQLASFGDYVIRGVKGEFYPCKPDIFELTYTAV